MKKLKLICTIIFSALLLSACEKAVNSEVNRQEPTKEFIKESESKQKVMTSTRAALEITCEGNCEGTERGCTVRIQGLPVEYIECDCEGCAMGFSSVAGIPYDETLSSYFDYVVSDVNDHFSKNYSSQQVSINSIFIYELTNNKVVIQVNYENPVNSIESDVTFELEFNESSEMVQKQKIDCSGACDESSESCRERYYPDSGAVECTCQGSCSMTVTQLPTGG